MNSKKHLIFLFRPGWKNVLSVSSSTTMFIICWQFAQFMLFTQTCAVFAIYLLGVLHQDSMHSILVAQVSSLPFLIYNSIPSALN